MDRKLYRSVYRNVSVDMLRRVGDEARSTIELLPSSLSLQNKKEADAYASASFLWSG